MCRRRGSCGELVFRKGDLTPPHGTTGTMVATLAEFEHEPIMMHQDRRCKRYRGGGGERRYGIRCGSIRKTNCIVRGKLMELNVAPVLAGRIQVPARRSRHLVVFVPELESASGFYLVQRRNRIHRFQWREADVRPIATPFRSQWNIWRHRCLGGARVRGSRRPRRGSRAWWLAWSLSWLSIFSDAPASGSWRGVASLAFLVARGPRPVYPPNSRMVTFLLMRDKTSYRH